MRRLRVVLVVTSLAALAVALAAPPSSAAERPRVRAFRAGAAIRVDGVLDEPDWSRAEPITGFRRIFVQEGQAPSESTEVRVLFDGSRIYFGVRCANRGPGRIRASLAPRDQAGDDDQIAIHLDTYRDFHRAYVFAVNPYGVQMDGIMTGTNEPDWAWDGVWSAATRRDSTGWTAELAVPLRTLRFPAGGSGTWGLWIRRQITKSDELCSWPLWRQSVQGDIMLQAADLEGLGELRGGGTSDLTPYAAAAWDERRTPDGDGALGPWRHDSVRNVGVDLRSSLTNTMVLNLTANPDYSQIEADALQIDVNQRYPLYFPEKRPFFLEGGDVFTLPMDLVYTRRMADPDYGFKTVGTVGKLRLGLGVVRDAGGASLAGVGAGPSAGAMGKGWFQFARTSLEVGDQSSVGLLAVAHQSDGPGLLAAPATVGGPVGASGSNWVLAADTRLRLTPRLFFTGQVATSRATQDSSFFLSILDTTGFGPGLATFRNRFSDVAYHGDLAWGDGVRAVQLFQDYTGPRFRDEVGFIQRVDVRKSGVNSSFYVRPENAWLRSIQPILDGYVMHDKAGTLQEWWWSPMIDWKFQKQSHVHTMFERVGERWLDRVYEQSHYILDMDNSLWRVLAVEVDLLAGDAVYYGATDSASYRGWTEQVAASATFRPAPSFTSALTASRSRFSRDHGRGVVFDVWVLGAKTTWQFTRELYARVYPQYDTEARHLDADALLGYVLHPGTVVYLGYNGDLDRLGARRVATGHGAFVKLSYVIQR